MVTSSEIRTFQSATEAEISQASSLIARGKGFATRGDPRLSSIVAVLGTLSQVQRDKAIAEARAKAQKEAGETVFVDGQGFSVRPEDQESFIQDALARGGDVQVGDRVIQSGVTPPREVISNLEERARLQKAGQQSQEETEQAFLSKGFTMAESEQLARVAASRGQTPSPAETKQILSEFRGASEGRSGFLEERIIGRTGEGAVNLQQTIGKVLIGTPTRLIAQADPIKRLESRIPILKTPVPFNLDAFGARVVTFAAFAPAMVTTSQFQLSQFRDTQAFFRGTSQRIEQNVLRSDINFGSTNVGRTLPKGVSFPSGKFVPETQVISGVRTGALISRTTLKPVGQKSFIVRTTARGLSAKTLGARFPDTTLGVTKIKNFVAIERGVSSDFGKMFVTITRGGKEVTLGLTKKSITVLGTVGKTDTGRTAIAGFIKNIPKAPKVLEPSVFFKVIKSKGTGASSIGIDRLSALQTQKLSTEFLQSANIQQTQKIIQAVVQHQPAVVQTSFVQTAISPITTQTIRSVSAPQLKLLTKDLSSPRVIQTPTQSPFSESRFSNIQKVGQQEISKSRSETSQVQKSIQTQQPRQQPIQIQRTSQNLIQRLRVAQIQTQIQTGRIAIRTPTVPRTPIRTPPIIPFFFPRTRPSTRTPARFPVELRRGGVFRIIGFGRTRQQAIGIGRTAAATTLGATFRVPTGRATKLFGFRTKQTKKGTEFIEMKKFRLSTKPELKEIQLARIRI